MPSQALFGQEERQIQGKSISESQESMGKSQAKDMKYSRCPQHNPKSWGPAIVLHFFPCFIHPAKNTT